MKKLLFLITITSLFSSCNLFQEEEQAKSPSMVPILESPTPSSRALVADLSNDQYPFDFFVPAIKKFEVNNDKITADDPYKVTWGDFELVFEISEKDGVYTYNAASADTYNFNIVYNGDENTFTYFHEINVDQETNDMDKTEANLVVKTVIPETSIGTDGEFQTKAKMAFYALGSANSWAPTPGMFSLYDEIEIYNGHITSVSFPDGDTTAQNGYGFAYYYGYYSTPTDEYDLSLTNSDLFTQLDSIMNDPDSYKNDASTEKFVQATIAVSLDDSTSFFETDADWTDRDHHLWTTQGPSFSTFKPLIPWNSSLSEN